MTRSTYLAALGILAATPLFSTVQPPNLCGTTNAGLSVWEGPKNFQTPTSVKFTLYVNTTTANSVAGPLVAYVVPVNKAQMTTGWWR